MEDLLTGNGVMLENTPLPVHLINSLYFSPIQLSYSAFMFYMKRTLVAFKTWIFFLFICIRLCYFKLLRRRFTWRKQDFVKHFSTKTRVSFTIKHIRYLSKLEETWWQMPFKVISLPFLPVTKCDKNQLIIRTYFFAISTEFLLLDLIEETESQKMYFETFFSTISNDSCLILLWARMDLSFALSLKL